MVALLLAASLAVVTSLVGTKLLIDWLVARNVGQPIHEDVPLGQQYGQRELDGVPLALNDGLDRLADPAGRRD